MKQYVQNYAVFLAFVAVTALVVKPLVSKMNVPLATKALGG